MKKPTLEEVKKYFKNAKEIKDHAGDVGFIEFDKIRFSADGRGVNQNRFTKNWLVLWHEEKGFAKILTTKEPTYSITADQLMQLENGFTLPKLKEWFPEVFVKKFKVGKWYKNATPCLFFCTGLNSKNQPLGHGFSESWRWLEDSSDEWDHEGIVEASEKEVFEALKNEAVKRGFVEGAVIRNIETSKEKYLKLSGAGFHLFNEKTLNFGNQVIFNNGIWAKVYQKL